MKNLVAFKKKQRWRMINEPVGKALGYPKCCIDAFFEQPPEVMQRQKPTLADTTRYNAAHLNGAFTGFVPCKDHAVKIISGEITLQSLIQNRNPSFKPFPLET